MRAIEAVVAFGWVAGTAGAISGCAPRALAPPVDAAPFADFFREPTCGGTTTVQGTTPSGPFAADLVGVRASWGASTSVLLDLGDSQSRWTIDVYAVWAPTDAGPALPAVMWPEYATAQNQAQPTRGYTIAATVDVSAATNPYDARDGGIPGAVVGSVKVSGDGFDLAGTVSSPYCVVFLDNASDHRRADAGPPH